jgi:hypothetical protein
VVGTGRVLAVALATLAQVPAQANERFTALAKAATATFAIATPPAAVNFDSEVVEAHALRLRLGAIELLYPKALLRAEQDLTDLRECAAAVCDMQELWGAWMSAPASAPDELEAAAKAVRTWIKGWRWSASATAGAIAAPTDEVAAMQRQFTAAVAALLSRDPAKCRAQCWLAPTRQHYAEMVGLLGAIAPENREFLWTEDVLESSEAWAVRPRVLQVVAMVYGSPAELGGELSDLRMDAREKHGLLQHVVQRTAASLAVLAFGDGLDRNFEAGLSQNLVIALYKENNARSGGSGRGGYAASRSQFVAGGASSGGTLAAINLDSQWRQTKGKDHFERPLKQGQKSGAKVAGAKDRAGKLGHFALQNDDGKPGHAVRAPFLVPPESLPGVPGDYDADFKELLRAYRSAFVHWLREAAGKSSADSRQKFAAMLRELAEGQGKVSFDLAVRRAYGERLTAEGPEPPSLEWKFLAWLAK